MDRSPVLTSHARAAGSVYRNSIDASRTITFWGEQGGEGEWRVSGPQGTVATIAGTRAVFPATRSACRLSPTESR